MNKGFTLVELLIVNAIIEILGTITLTNVAKCAREKAHDAKEIAQLEQLERALWRN